MKVECLCVWQALTTILLLIISRREEEKNQIMIAILRRITIREENQVEENQQYMRGIKLKVFEESTLPSVNTPSFFFHRSN